MRHWTNLSNLVNVNSINNCPFLNNNGKSTIERKTGKQVEKERTTETQNNKQLKYNDTELRKEKGNT